MNKSVVKSAGVKESSIPPMYFYGAIAVGIIVLCLVSWKVYTSHDASASTVTINAREAAKQGH